MSRLQMCFILARIFFDDHQRGSHFDHLAVFADPFGDGSLEGRRDFHGRFIRQHLHDGLILFHAVSLLDQPLNDLSFDNAFSDVR